MRGSARMLTPAASPKPVLQARGLSKHYGARRAIDGVDMRLQESEVVALLGPNGAGKSTFLRCALGLVRPTAGSVRVFGSSPHSGDRSVMRRVGYVPERYALYPALSGWEHLDLFGRLSGLDQKQRQQRLEEVARSLGVEDRLDERVRHYSHGLRQRLVIAQALLAEPELLLLDEPTNGLDPDGVETLWSLLRRMSLTGTTVLVSSHRLQELEAVAGRVAVMLHGRVLMDGKLDELKAAKDGPLRLQEVYERLTQEAGP